MSAAFLNATIMSKLHIKWNEEEAELEKMTIVILDSLQTTGARTEDKRYYVKVVKTV